MFKDLKDSEGLLLFLQLPLTVQFLPGGPDLLQAQGLLEQQLEDLKIRLEEQTSSFDRGPPAKSSTY